VSRESNQQLGQALRRLYIIPLIPAFLEVIPRGPFGAEKPMFSAEKSIILAEKYGFLIGLRAESAFFRRQAEAEAESAWGRRTVCGRTFKVYLKPA
jgi:hypothetical protein